jgi:succinyl-CoA synthetase beta subunit
MRLREKKAAELLGRFGAPFLPEPPPDGPRERPDTESSLMITADPATQKVLLLLSRKAVQAWGQMVEKQPRELSREHLEAGQPVEGFVGRELARRAGFSGTDQSRVEKLVAAAYRLFVEMDCIWVELGFVKTRDGFCTVRASVEVDESALFRHPELEGSLQNTSPLPRTQREKAARAAKIEYVELDGDLGILPGGIGFGLAAVDLIHHIGGKPANVMDSGGEATPQRIRDMMDLLLDDPRVLAVFGCRYAGLTRADGWAKLMIQYIIEKNPQKPIVLRLAGNAEDEARKLFEDAAQENATAFSKVVVFHSNTPVDNAAREAVALVDMIQKGEDPFSESPVAPAETPKPEAPNPPAPKRPDPDGRNRSAGAEGAGKGGG